MNTMGRTITTNHIDTILFLFSDLLFIYFYFSSLGVAGQHEFEDGQGAGGLTARAWWAWHAAGRLCP